MAIGPVPRQRVFGINKPMQLRRSVPHVGAVVYFTRELDRSGGCRRAGRSTRDNRHRDRSLSRLHGHREQHARTVHDKCPYRWSRPTRRRDQRRRARAAVRRCNLRRARQLVRDRSPSQRGQGQGAERGRAGTQTAGRVPAPDRQCRLDDETVLAARARHHPRQDPSRWRTLLNQAGFAIEWKARPATLYWFARKRQCPAPVSASPPA